MAIEGDRRVEEIVHELQAATLGGHAIAGVLPRLRKLVDADRAAAHKLVRTKTGWKAEFAFLEGFATGAEKAFHDWLATAPPDSFGYDPMNPAPEQRNVVIRARAALAADQVARTPVVSQLFPKVGLAGMDQMRVLVCDGAQLLAWVGVFRTRSFTEPDERAFQALVPAMLSRLQMEAALLR